MFCPQCGIEDIVNQRYCKHCGQLLTSVELAMEGSFDRSFAELRRCERALTTGGIFVGIYSLLVIFGLAFALFKGNIDIGKAFIIPSFMLLIAVPYLLWGALQFARLMQPLKARIKPSAVDRQSNWIDAFLPIMQETLVQTSTVSARLLPEEKIPAPVSLFDYRTDDLQTPEK
jgi:hypothetical protein